LAALTLKSPRKISYWSQEPLIIQEGAITFTQLFIYERLFLRNKSRNKRLCWTKYELPVFELRTHVQNYQRRQKYFDPLMYCEKQAKHSFIFSFALSHDLSERLITFTRNSNKQLISKNLFMALRASSIFKASIYFSIFPS